MPKIGWNDGCPYCGNLEVYRSQAETVLDRMCVLLLLELARCHGCMRQHYRLLFCPAQDFPSRSVEKILPSPGGKDQTDPLTDEAA